MSKFGVGGGGAPLRDQNGNIIAIRKPGAQSELANNSTINEF